MEVREEVANYNVMSIEINTHTHGIELQHNRTVSRGKQCLKSKREAKPFEPASLALSAGY